MLDFRLFSTRHIRLVLQTETGECGLACLAMIARFWGQSNDLAALRSRFRVSLKGTSLKTLMKLAALLGLRPRAIKIDLDQLNRIALPSILHWDFNHFVVLGQIKNGKAVIYDPAIGERRLPMAEVSKHFSGIALELIPETNFSRVNSTRRFTILSLMGTIVGIRGKILRVLALGILLQAITLILPFYIQWVVDKAIIGNDASLLTLLALVFMLLAGLQAIVNTLKSWLVTVISADVNFQWMGNVYHHLLRLPIQFFEQRHIGDVISRFSSVQIIQKALTNQSVEAIIDGMLVSITFSLMVWYNFKLSLISVASAILYICMRFLIYGRVMRATSEQILHAARQQTHFFESVRGIQAIRLFRRMDDRQQTWMGALTDQMNAELRVSRFSVFVQTTSGLLSNLERILVVWVAAILVLESHFSVGMLFAYLSFKEQFSQRVTALVDKVFDWKILHVHGERLADIVLSEREQSIGKISQSSDIRTEVEVEVCDLWFRYADDEPYVISGVNFHISKGEYVAITGPSGSGKTTLLKIMLGLLEPTRGEILINGVPLRTFGLDGYREIIGTVLQGDVLFSGSIAENISFFDVEPEFDRIVACAKAASIHDEIERMPMNYETLIGNIGIGLSGGQQQRILLARALYKSPKILFLDEATSNLDLENERVVNSSVENLNLTRIVIAHRRETIEMAERVIEINKDGRISSSSVDKVL